MACTCTVDWRARNWTAKGPTPHGPGCSDGNYSGFDYDDLLLIGREITARRVEDPRSDAARFRRPSREAYLRASRTLRSGVTVEPGIEYRDGDSFADMTAELDAILIGTERDDSDLVRIGRFVEVTLKTHWPDRAYFVEVHDKRGRWIQIFQPFGVPRNT